MPPSPANQTEKRKRSERDGRRAELLAGLLLNAKLYRIRNRRYKTPVGEIDLVADHFGTIVFVEVKTRSGTDGERDALLAVNRRRLIQAAEYFRMRHPQLAGRPMRFDVIFLAQGIWPRHVMSAFSA